MRIEGEGNGSREELCLNCTSSQGNQIGDDGARAVAEAIQASRSLTGIYLQREEKKEEWTVRDERERALSEMLSFSFVAVNAIGNAGAVAIAEAIRAASSLQWIDLRGKRRAVLRGKRQKKKKKGMS